MDNGNHGEYIDRAMRAHDRAMRAQENAMREQERVMRHHEQAMQQATGDMDRAMRHHAQAMQQATGEMDRAFRRMNDNFRGFSGGVFDFRASSMHADGLHMMTPGPPPNTTFSGEGGVRRDGGSIRADSFRCPPNSYRMGPTTFVVRDPENFQGYFSCTSSHTSVGHNGETYSANSTATFGPGGVREMHSTEKNQNGQTITVERGLGDRSRRITRTRDQTGREEARDTLRNVRFEETDEFDQEWSQAARRLPRGNNNGQGQGRIGFN